MAMLMPIFRELGKKSSARATTRRTNSCMRRAESVRAPAPGSGRASWHAETGRHLGDLGVRLPPGVPRMATVSGDSKKVGDMLESMRLPGAIALASPPTKP